jgi:ATP-binding cassette, subfamily F, member 3
MLVYLILLPMYCMLLLQTNHLDMETINALINALREFKGAVICVSHDQHFITQVRTCSSVTYTYS